MSEAAAPQRSAEDTRQQEAVTVADEDGENSRGTQGDTKSEIESTKYVIDRIVDHRDDEKRPLYRLWWYVYSAKDDIWAPAENLPQQFVVRYEKRVDEGDENSDEPSFDGTKDLNICPD